MSRDITKPNEAMYNGLCLAAEEGLLELGVHVSAVEMLPDGVKWSDNLGRKFKAIIVEEGEDGMPRYDPRFTEADQQLMFEGALDEGNDLGRKDIAQLVLDTWDLTGCIAACSIINGEHQCTELAEMLKAVEDGKPVSAPELFAFAERMKLIKNSTVTDLGLEYMSSLL